jgi:hypothetical protein
MTFDKLLQSDKFLHFIAGGAVAGVVFGATDDLGWSLLGTVLAGVGKEVYDHYHPESQKADVWDALATFAGWLPLAGASVGRHWMIA